MINGGENCGKRKNNQCFRSEKCDRNYPNKPKRSASLFNIKKRMKERLKDWQAEVSGKGNSVMEGAANDNHGS